MDWDSDPNWEWESAAEDTPEHLVTLWQDAVARSRAAVAEALAAGGLDQLVKRITNDRGESPSLRRVLIDLIEEYSRHTGHADLIRESVDGLVGRTRRTDGPIPWQRRRLKEHLLFQQSLTDLRHRLRG